MARIKDQAICIRHLDWSQTSQIVVLLGREHGKVRGVAKGAKRLSPGSIARFSGGIELLTGGQFVAVTRPSAELATITEWDLQQPFHHLHEDLAAQQLALYGADLVNAMLIDHDPHPRVLAALADYLQELACRSTHGAALLHFQWTVLTECGYRPQIDEDVVHGGALGDGPACRFDARRGGLTRAAAAAAPGTWGVRRQTVALLRQVAGGSFQSDADTMQRANRLLCAYLRALLDRQLPTMRFVLDR